MSNVGPAMAGGISLGLHRYDVDDPVRAIDLMVEDAQLAERAGFDGVTLSEYHGGFVAYFPNPLLGSAFILDATDRVWSGPFPTLLTHRPPSVVVEDLAWLAARHPGRVVGAFAAGGTPPSQYDPAPSSLVGAFTEGLGVVQAALAGGDDAGPLGADLAVRAARRRIPLYSAVMSRTAATRAARFDLGILLGSMATPDHLELLASRYGEASGTGPRGLIRKVWVGTPVEGALEKNLTLHPLDERTVADALAQRATGEVDDIVERLAAIVESCGIGTLNFRVHVWGVPPGVIQEQIERMGAELLPALRARLGWPAPTEATVASPLPRA